ncbi:MAG: hypothetical protein IK118_07805, partial [Clostridia bacterium]|nr:hypothetical protein [Clostridia bacterium]
MLNVYKYEGFGKHFQKLRDLRTRRKWAKQRAKRGFCDRDLWAIDTWFIEIMPEMLEALADRATGYPNRLWDDYYETHKDEFAIPEDTPPKKLRALGVSH